MHIAPEHKGTTERLTHTQTHTRARAQTCIHKHTLQRLTLIAPLFLLCILFIYLLSVETYFHVASLELNYKLLHCNLRLFFVPGI